MNNTMSDMDKINAYARKALTEEEVYTFSLTLCDNDVDRDFERFSTEALEELSKLFPGKTGIFDHSMKSADQKARIFEAFTEKSENEKNAAGEPLVRLKARAYMLKNEANQLLIDEIEGGIKKEVSVSCSMGSAVCSVCGKDRRKVGCEHLPGRYYGKALCHTVLSEATDAYEFSFVAVPAQRGAGVTKAFLKQEETAMQDFIEKIHAGDGLTLSGAETKQLGAYIDSLQESAGLGEQYKKELCREVTRLFALRLPEVDAKLFSSVTAVMTVNELLGFKEGLEKTEKGVVPQLAAEPAQGTAAKDYSQFRI